MTCGDLFQKAERTTSLFALAIADVLIINMWWQDVGRHGASNLAVLKDIFELNMKLFNKNAAKKFLFIIRDFEAGNEERVKDILKNNMKDIWSKCEMPDQYKDKNPADVFTFEFEFLPHMKYEQEQFNAQAMQLKARFELDAPNTLFLSDAMQKNTPMVDLPDLIQRNWKLIVTEDYLNLPNQQDLIADLRCKRVKEEAYRHVESELQTLISQSAEVINNFKDQVGTILSKATTFYTSRAALYNPEKQDFYKIELETTIKKELFPCFKD